MVTRQEKVWTINNQTGWGENTRHPERERKANCNYYWNRQGYQSHQTSNNRDNQYTIGCLTLN